MDRASRLHLVGDAVGVPYEFRPADRVGRVVFGAHGTHGQPPGTWSDDGALTLALLDSLLEAPFDPADQAARFLAWADRGAYTPDGDGPFDMGNTTRDALDRPRAGTPAERARGTGRWDNGNGSLMRILPIALVEPDAPVARLVTHAERASRVTHGHPLSLAACALYTLIVQELLMGAPEPAAALRRARTSLRTHYASTGEASRLEALDELEAWPERNGSGYVCDALWSAWDAFAEGGSYPATIERAVGYGNDTDSTACIAGALAGAHFGVEAIPPAWRSGMRGTAIVAPLLDRLLARARLR